MTGRERVLTVLSYKEADRVPRYDSFWEETIDRYESESGKPMKELLESFDFDIITFSMDVSMRFPVGREDHGDFEIIKDRCGYTVKKYKRKSLLGYQRHEVVGKEDWERERGRLSLDKEGESRMDTEAYFLRTHPAPAWEDAVRNINAAGGDKFRLLQFYGPFEATWRHHGHENTMMDCLLEPELVSEMFEASTDLTIETLEYGLSLGLEIDGCWMVEDLAYTKSLLISPETYRALIFPQHKRLGDYFHKKGLKFFVHACGDTSAILPDFIEAGVDALQPLQANTRMRVPALKEQYGNKITLFGNVDVRKLTGSFADIEEEVRRVVVPGKKGGGYIYHSDHSIPPEISLENYMYLIKVLDEIG